MLLRRLPPESATATEMRRNAEYEQAEKAEDYDVETEQWSRSEQLLAAVKDELSVLRFLYERSHSKQKPKWKPTPTPRPGVKPKRKRPKLNAEQLAQLEAYLARTQGPPKDN